MTNKGMAKDTLDILARKYYINEQNETIYIENELEACKKEPFCIHRSSFLK